MANDAFLAFVGLAAERADVDRLCLHHSVQFFPNARSAGFLVASGVPGAGRQRPGAFLACSIWRVYWEVWI